MQVSQLARREVYTTAQELAMFQDESQQGIIKICLQDCIAVNKCQCVKIRMTVEVMK